MQMRTTAMLAVGSIALAACGGDSDGGGDGFVVGGLAEIPADLRDSGERGDLQIVVTDISRASDLLGLEPPAPDRSADSIREGAGALQGFPGPDAARTPLSVFLPGLLGESGTWLAPEKVEADTGMSPGAIESLVTADATPISFAVTRGALEVAPSLADLGDGVVTVGDGEDLEPNVEATSEWRALGRPVRLAQRDGAVAWSLSTPLTRDWAGGVDQSLAAVEQFAQAARALDDRDVVSAILIESSFIADGRAPQTASPAEIEEYLATIPDVAPFSLVAVGVAVTADEPRSIVVYAFGSEGAAEGAVEPLRDAWANSTDRDGRPVSVRFTIDAIVAEGSLVVLELSLGVDSSTTTPAQMVFARETVFLHP